jgi:phosphoribosylamine--glycine ligase
MKILVIGGGAREHAIAWKLSRERSVTGIVCAPGNPGIAAVARCVPADVGDPRQLLDVARSQGIDLTVVGPELPLSRGVVDLFTENGRAIVGPSKAAARSLRRSQNPWPDTCPATSYRVCDSASAA